MKLILFLSICLIASFTVVTALEVGETNVNGVEIELPQLPEFDNSTASVNNSNTTSWWVTTDLGPIDSVSDISYDDISAGDVNALGYTVTTNFLAGVVGQLSMDGDPWYLGGTDFEIDLDLKVKNIHVEENIEVYGTESYFNTTLEIDGSMTDHGNATLVIRADSNHYSCINLTEGSGNLGFAICNDGSGSNRLVFSNLHDGFEWMWIDRDSGEIHFLNDTFFTNLTVENVITTGDINASAIYATDWSNISAGDITDDGTWRTLPNGSFTFDIDLNGNDILDVNTLNVSTLLSPNAFKSIYFEDTHSYIRGGSGIGMTKLFYAEIFGTDFTYLELGDHLAEIAVGDVGASSLLGITPTAMTFGPTTAVVKLGASQIGAWPLATTFAMFGNQNLNHAVAGNYALLQSNAGATFLNSATGQTIGFRIANAQYMTMNTHGLGVGSAASGSFPIIAIKTQDATSYIAIANLNAGTSASAGLWTQADSSLMLMRSFGTGVVDTRWGKTLGGNNEIITQIGELYIGTNMVGHDVVLGTAKVARIVLNATSNSTWVNGTLNQTNGNATINNIYGEMWSHNDTGVIKIDMSGGNAWVNITINSTLAAAGQTLNGFAYDATDSYLQVQVDGLYDCSYDMSTGNTGNNQEYQFLLSINNIPQNNTDTHRKIGAAGDVGDLGDRGYLDLNIGDLVNLQARNNDGTSNLEAHAISVNCLRIGN